MNCWIYKLFCLPYYYI